MKVLFLLAVLVGVVLADVSHIIGNYAQGGGHQGGGHLGVGRGPQHGLGFGSNFNQGQHQGHHPGQGAYYGGGH